MLPVGGVLTSGESGQVSYKGAHHESRRKKDFGKSMLAAIESKDKRYSLSFGLCLAGLYSFR